MSIMKEINLRLTQVAGFLWLLYFIFSIFTSYNDSLEIKKVNWYNAKNMSSTYKGFRATTVNYTFQKNEISIQRKYGYFTQGLCVYLWDIDKDSSFLDISFFVKKEHYNAIKLNRPHYKNTWFTNVKKKDEIPFFGLRKLNKNPNKFIIFLDLWKYNYSIVIALAFLLIPIFIVYILKKITKNKTYSIEETCNVNADKWTNKVYLIFLLTILLRFII